MTTDAALSTTQLTKRYARTGPPALDGLDLTVATGEVHGFLGPNGAGKTTTLRILLGLLRATGGTAQVLGLDPWRDAVAVHDRIAYVPGDVTLWPSLTGGEVIDLLGRLRSGSDRHRRDQLIEAFELDPSRRCRTYSKGNRQKVALIAAFAAHAELLILDEPTSGLDPLMEETFRTAVREVKDDGRTVLLSSHILAEAEQLCDRVSIIRAGRLIESAPLADLRGARQSVVVAEVAAPIGDGLLDGLSGLDQVEVDGSTLRCRIAADGLDPLLGRLTSVGVRSLTCTPPSLEDVFLTYYGSVR